MSSFDIRFERDECRTKQPAVFVDDEIASVRACLWHS